MAEDIEEHLNEIGGEDVDPHSGKLFSLVYETGDETLKEVAREALLQFSEKNILDFTVFRSAIHFEREIVNFAKDLMNGGDDVVGSYTFGGTESIFLAVKSARDLYRKENKESVPEIIVPETIHPSFYKAADYMGLEVERVPIDENIKADVEAIKKAIGPETALIALSAPNWPYGTIDPIEEVAGIASDEDVPLHVDACLGGFILPWFEELGEEITPFDFSVEGVTSISLDAHKYGYAPKGSSVVLFKTAEMKKQSMFVDASNPGYIFVNQAVLSSRPVGPLASAYAVIEYLGDEGYRRLAEKVLSARNKIYEGLSGQGFETVAPIESSVLSLYNENIDLPGFVANMEEKGWHVSLQKGIEEFEIPLNIHLTISPIHDSMADEFINDSDQAVTSPEKSDTEVLESIRSGDMQRVIEDLNAGKINSTVIPLILDDISEEDAVELIKEIVIEWFK